MDKDSFPGLYDTSSAGHIPAGSEPLPSAIRELQEELGIEANSEQLVYTGSFRILYKEVLHGQIFRDNEVEKRRIIYYLKIEILGKFRTVFPYFKVRLLIG